MREQDHEDLHKEVDKERESAHEMSRARVDHAQVEQTTTVFVEPILQPSRTTRLLSLRESDASLGSAVLVSLSWSVSVVRMLIEVLLSSMLRHALDARREWKLLMHFASKLLLYSVVAEPSSWRLAQPSHAQVILVGSIILIVLCRRLDRLEPY